MHLKSNVHHKNKYTCQVLLLARSTTVERGIDTLSNRVKGISIFTK